MGHMVYCNVTYTTKVSCVSIRLQINRLCFALTRTTTPDLHITTGIITIEFVRTGSDVPSLPVMSLKMKK